MFRRHKRSNSASQPATGVGRAKSMERCQSLPSSLDNIKGIMKHVTLDQSLHSKYGETKEGEERRNIQFKDLLIREYARTVGDNPSCSSGPPISIAWEYNPETKIISIDKYEDRRPPRRSNFEMVLPRDMRQQMLRREWDVSQAQIASAVRNNIKVKNQRRATVNNLGKATRMEELMESASRKVKRGLLLQRSPSKMASILEEQHQKAQREMMLKNQFFAHDESDDVEETKDNPALDDEDDGTGSITPTAEEEEETSSGEHDESKENAAEHDESKENTGINDGNGEKVEPSGTSFAAPIVATEPEEPIAI